MWGKQHARHRCRELAAEQQGGCIRVQRRDDSVKEYVAEMVAGWMQPMEGMVQTECQHAQRPVRLVRPTVHQRCTPEVIVEDVHQGCFRGQVGVFEDGTAEREKKIGIKIRLMYIKSHRSVKGADNEVMQWEEVAGNESQEILWF